MFDALHVLLCAALDMFCHSLGIRKVRGQSGTACYVCLEELLGLDHGPRFGADPEFSSV